MNPSEINVQPTMEQLFAIIGEQHIQIRLYQAIIAQHPEIIATHAVMPPEPNGAAVAGVVVGAAEE